jgi:hypothetical protein
MHDTVFPTGKQRERLRRTQRLHVQLRPLVKRNLHACKLCSKPYSYVYVDGKFYDV